MNVTFFTFSAAKIQSVWTLFYPSPWKYDPSLLKYDYLAKINLYRGGIILIINILPKPHIFQLYEGKSGFGARGYGGCWCFVFEI